MESKNYTTYRIGMTLTGLLFWVGFMYFRALIYATGWIDISLELKLFEAAGWTGLVVYTALTLYAWIWGAERIVGWINKGMKVLAKFRWLSLPAAVGLFILFPIQVVGGNGVYLENHYTRLAVYLLFGLVCGVLIKVWRQKTRWIEALTLSLLILATTYNAASYAPLVSDYPLSLDWSEASRYYYASTFFSKRLYGIELPWPHNHFTRYLMQSVPFLFPNLSIWAHRLWQSVLRFVFPFLAGYLLSRRLKLKDPLYTLATAAWAGLFFFQGPVFYQMLVMVVLVLWLFDSQKFWRSSIVVAVCSIWAGFTRINWVPMPGLIAASLYLLERPIPNGGVKGVTRYLVPPAAWALSGGIIGLLAQDVYALGSGLAPEVIYGYATSDLLWYRLWPNLSYPIGILPSVLMISGPILVFVALAFVKWGKDHHGIRMGLLAAGLTILFAGGLVVSVKIGGGTNLHNMDAFITLLAIIGAYLFYGTNPDLRQEMIFYKPHWVHLTLVVMIPAIFAVTYGGQIPKLDYEAADYIVNSLQFEVDKAKNQYPDKEILFVTERQLITFGNLEGVDLVNDYEKMILTEMAMGNVKVYLDQFAEDIKNQRFSLIIHNVLPGYYKDPQTYSFAEENNVYLERVATVIKCYYEPKKLLIPYHIHILTPSEEPLCD
jgi:hypothetical protein